MELKEIRKKSDEELKKNLAEQREKLREFRFKVSTKQHKIVSDVKKIKIIISRILTVMQERKLNLSTSVKSLQDGTPSAGGVKTVVPAEKKE
jgi:ribosomal protein L29